MSAPRYVVRPCDDEDASGRPRRVWDVCDRERERATGRPWCVETRGTRAAARRAAARWNLEVEPAAPAERCSEEIDTTIG